MSALNRTTTWTAALSLAIIGELATGFGLNLSGYSVDHAEAKIVQEAHSQMPAHVLKALCFRHRMCEVLKSANQ